MKVTKLVIGILMIIFSVLISVQSMAAGLVNIVESKGNTSGSAGILLSIGYLVSGIVYLSTKSRKGLGGDIANAVILGIVGLISLSNSDKVFQDLLVWTILGFIIGFGFLIWHILVNRRDNNSESDYQNNNYQYSDQQFNQMNQSFSNYPNQQNNNLDQSQYPYYQNNRQQSSGTYPSRSQLHSRKHK